MRMALNLITRFKKIVAAASSGWALGAAGFASGNGTSSATATLSGTTAGNTVVIGVVVFSSGTVSTITCSGETITAIGAVQASAAGQISDARIQLYVIDHLASGGTKAINVTTAGTFIDVGAREFSGGISGSTLDATNKAQANTVSLTTTTNNCLICSVGVSAGAISATANYTADQLSHNAENDSFFFLTSLDAGTAGATTVDFSGSGSAVINVASFKKA